MKPVKSILVVVDRSPSAADAVRKAVLLARAAGAGVELFMCDAERGYSLSQAYVPTGVEQARQACLIESRRHLEMLQRMANAGDVPITIDVACESPLYESIVKKVMRDRPDLVGILAEEGSEGIGLQALQTGDHDGGAVFCASRGVVRALVAEKAFDLLLA